MLAHFAKGQDTATISAIKNELALIYERDQKTRKGTDSASYVAFIDSTNLVRVEYIVKKYGWLGRSAIGTRANFTLYLVIQHAELEVQEKYLPLLKKSVDDSESRPVDLAYLQDRVLMRKGKKQLYGSQVVFDKTGAQVLHPIEDEKNVNVRRAGVGLEPLEEYAKFFGINYQLPKE
ncbi:MAG: hypothetical protein K0Q79_2320 [Flavipsychrobacter sp.]|jgi:hypothetical protein|nr:hypothetical protein [Flavipsychrobacter sp.]